MIEKPSCAVNAQTMIDLEYLTKYGGIGTDIASSIRWNSGVSYSDSAVSKYVTNMLRKYFKGNMKSEAYKPRKFKRIKCPQELDCDFDRKRKCNWHNVKHDGGKGGSNLLLGSGKPDTKNISWSVIMGNNQTPNPPYGLVVSQKTKTSIWFVSYPLPRQPGDATVSLRYWISPQISMRACTRLYDKEEDPKKRKKPLTFLSCSERLYYNTDPGPETLTVKGPINDWFEVVLEFGPWPLKQGGLVIVDDIKYRSGLC